MANEEAGGPEGKGAAEQAPSGFFRRGCVLKETTKGSAVGEAEFPLSKEVLHQVVVPEGNGWKTWIAFLGPGFLVSIAYIDPGNFQSNLQAGANYKYELLWVLLLFSIAASLIQSLAIKLGMVTGMHLAEHCREEYPPRVKIALWIFAELAIVASDIPEVIGTAFALQILFGLTIWIGVLITGCSTLLLLGLQRYGVRKLEVFIAVLVMTVAVCFFVELGNVDADGKEVVKGLFVPQLRDSQALAIAISLVGAVVMPHNLYLHSGLVLSREVTRNDKAIRDGCRYNYVESGIAIMLAFLINVAIVVVSGAVCSKPDLSASDRDHCDNLDLNRVPFLLKSTLGSWSGKVFGIALLAAGQSSTITGTYAGQFVMQGFLNLKVKAWLRNLVTRLVAIVPSLAIAIIGGSRGAGRLIIISSMILAFELPFALLPLLKFTSNSRKMGSFKNSILISVTTYGISLAIILANIYFLISAGVDYVFKSKNMGIKAGGGTALVLAMAAYLAFIGYLAFRRDREVPSAQPPEAGAVAV